METVEPKKLEAEKVVSSSLEPKERIEAEKPEALNSSSEVSKKESRRQSNRNYYLKNREKIVAKSRERHWKNRDREIARSRRYYQKNRERIRAESRERYHFDPIYREKQRVRLERWLEKRKEAYERFVKEYGGKCMVCGNDDIKVIIPHHLDGKEEKVPFIQSKEFSRWIKYGIKLNVVLMDANCHFKLHRGEATLQ